MSWVASWSDCSERPLTGFFRDGCCNTSESGSRLSHRLHIDDRRVSGLLQCSRQRPQHARAGIRVPRPLSRRSLVPVRRPLAGGLCGRQGAARRASGNARAGAGGLPAGRSQAPCAGSVVMEARRPFPRCLIVSEPCNMQRAAHRGGVRGIPAAELLRRIQNGQGLAIRRCNDRPRSRSAEFKIPRRGWLEVLQRVWTEVGKDNMLDHRRLG